MAQHTCNENCLQLRSTYGLFALLQSFAITKSIEPIPFDCFSVTPDLVIHRGRVAGESVLHFEVPVIPPPSRDEDVARYFDYRQGAGRALFTTILANFEQWQAKHVAVEKRLLTEM